MAGLNIFVLHLLFGESTALPNRKFLVGSAEFVELCH